MIPRRRSRILRHRFVVLLAALLVQLVATAFDRGGETNLLRAGARTAVFALLLLAAVNAVRTRRRRLFVAGTIVAAAIAARVASLEPVARALTTDAHLGLEVASISLGILALLYVSVLILGNVFATTRVTIDTIAAALSVYLLLGVLWALAYSLVDLVRAGSFSVPIGEVGAVTGLYYSFVTLTTVGYGDITPLSPLAQTLSVTESIVGQFYLAVLVARLVGLHIVHAGTRDERGSD